MTRGIRPEPGSVESPVGLRFSLPGPPEGPITVWFGAGRAGFLLQPAKSSAALATTRQIFFETFFME